VVPDLVKLLDPRHPLAEPRLAEREHVREPSLKRRRLTQHETPRERDRDTGLDERGGLNPFRLGDQIERPEFVLDAPATPIRQIGHPVIELLGCHVGRGFADILLAGSSDRDVVTAQ
jgi:hypothetical protein